MATHLFSWVITKRNCIERKGKIWLQQQQQLLVTAAAALQEVEKKKTKDEQISLQDPINQPWNSSWSPKKKFKLQRWRVDAPPEQILIKVDCKVESSAEEPNTPGLISAQTYISAVELVGMILDEVESWDWIWE